ncbi:MAG: HDOD domain-containing protein [Saccharospirillaceae bacterium]|nr:HDOD domain-containing protein [Pseudomonadales bacterium]NRB81413.1 HDOD domain-containing protein [Saccharospirillaceae bacterium]
MIEELAQRLIDKSVQGKLTMPMLPEVAQKAMQLAQDPDSDSLSLANLIQSDQSLAAHVMRISNSATYSPNGNIISLQQAISRLGMNMIAEITLTAALSAVRFKIKGFESTLDTIWQHALLSGLWSKEVARKARKNVEAAYIGGLLHSIGKPVIIQALVNENMNITPEQCLKVCELCFLQIGVDIAKHWKMPDQVVKAIQIQDSNELSDAVYIGSQFAMVNMTEDKDWDQLIGQDRLNSLNLYEEDVQDLIAKHEDIEAAKSAMMI